MREALGFGPREVKGVWREHVSSLVRREARSQEGAGKPGHGESRKGSTSDWSRNQVCCLKRRRLEAAGIRWPCCFFKIGQPI